MHVDATERASSCRIGLYWQGSLLLDKINKVDAVVAQRGAVNVMVIYSTHFRGRNYFQFLALVRSRTALSSAPQHVIFRQLGSFVCSAKYGIYRKARKRGTVPYTLHFLNRIFICNHCMELRN